jgi:hypothetical protein
MATVSRKDKRVENLIGVAAFVIFAVLWAVFAYALVASQGSLDATWAWLNEQHIVVQVIGWFLFLPVTAGLWVWQTGWPLVGRLVVIGGLASITLYVFFPRFLIGGRP